MYTTPFDSLKACSGEPVYLKSETEKYDCEPGKVLAIHDNFAWVKWKLCSTITDISKLAHKDPKAQPINLFKKDWYCIWVRNRTSSTDVWLIRSISTDSFDIGKPHMRVYEHDYPLYEIAPTPAGPWLPMVK